MLDLNSLDPDEIGFALADQIDCEHWWLIDPETGKIEQKRMPPAASSRIIQIPAYPLGYMRR